MEMLARPRLDFLVIGAQKCATSWMYYCLKEHPELFLPATKREVHYLGGEVVRERGEAWYFSLVEGATPQQKTGDVSVQYLFDPRSPALVHQWLPDVRLIVSLRNPVDRAVSAYYWYVRKQLLPVDLSLEDALYQAIDATRTEPEPGSRAATVRELVDRGCYDVQLERYLRYFRPDQFLLVLYEEISADPLPVIQQVYRGLGVAPDFVPESLNTRPKQNSYARTLFFLERLATRNPRDLRSRVVSTAANLSNQLLCKLGRASDKPRLSPALTGALTDFFAPHVARTGRMLLQTPAANRPSRTDLASLWRL
jgi:hypothetical protein